MTGVDIGTEWNLKWCKCAKSANPANVDIGTEWNLKVVQSLNKAMAKVVDIGTEWNLKPSHFHKLQNLFMLI